MITSLRRLFAANAIERQLYPAPKVSLSFRTYTPGDFGRCVEIHDANAEGRFPQGSRRDFLDYLQRVPTGLIIAETEGEIAGFGGLSVVSENVHVLCFGMVHPEFQGLGVGSTLALPRLQAAARVPDVHFVVIYAVQKSLTFYERFGFESHAVWIGPDGKEYPIGLLNFWSHQLNRVDKVLAQRGHCVRGDFRADPSGKMGARVTEVSMGNYRMEMFLKESGETLAAGPA